MGVPSGWWAWGRSASARDSAMAVGGMRLRGIRSDQNRNGLRSHNQAQNSLRTGSSIHQTVVPTIAVPHEDAGLPPKGVQDVVHDLNLVQVLVRALGVVRQPVTQEIH